MSGAAPRTRCKERAEKLMMRTGVRSRCRSRSSSSRSSTWPAQRVGCLVSMASSTGRGASATRVSRRSRVRTEVLSGSAVTPSGPAAPRGPAAARGSARPGGSAGPGRSVGGAGAPGRAAAYRAPGAAVGALGGLGGGGRVRDSAVRVGGVRVQCAVRRLVRVGVPVHPGAEVERGQVRELQGRDGAAAVGGAVHPAVVDADQMAVRGEPYVALQPVGALFDGPAIGGQRVLGCRLGGTAMGYDGRQVVEAVARPGTALVAHRDIVPPGRMDTLCRVLRSTSPAFVGFRAGARAEWVRCRCAEGRFGPGPPRGGSVRARLGWVP